MKLILLLPFFLLLTRFFAQDKVYICHSKTSYAYHNKLCRGLKNCTHKIDTVTIKEAKELGHGKPCENCY